MRSEQAYRAARWGSSRGLRAVRGGVRRVSRRLARAVLPVRQLATGRARRRGVFVLTSGAEVGRLPADVRDAIGSAAGARVPVELLVLDSAVSVVPPVFPVGVAVRRFWEDAGPSGDRSVPAYDHDGLTVAPVPGPRGSWRPGYYRDGLPVLARAETAAGAWVEHFGPGGSPVRRDELDEQGRLVRVVDLDPATGREVAHRYLDAQGSCWLSVEIDADGTAGRALRFQPHAEEYRSLRSVQAEWVAGRIAGTVRPVVLAAGPASGEVASLVSGR